MFYYKRHRLAKSSISSTMQHVPVTVKVKRFMPSETKTGNPTTINVIARGFSKKALLSLLSMLEGITTAAPDSVWYYLEFDENVRSLQSRACDHRDKNDGDNTMERDLYRNIGEEVSNQIKILAVKDNFRRVRIFGLCAGAVVMESVIIGLESDDCRESRVVVDKVVLFAPALPIQVHNRLTPVFLHWYDNDTVKPVEKHYELTYQALRPRQRLEAKVTHVSQNDGGHEFNPRWLIAHVV